ncbi:MAG: glutamate 5-kinase [Fusobacterium sp. JB021]|nr:glutamate 5-kinase [Fusobacterium sp. JB021]MDP0506934.1 glutamate 5-kinase [Fusobacterium sp. JB019]
MDREILLKNVKRVVIKIGTSTLTHENGYLNINKIEKLVRNISHIQNLGYEVIVVSSGAVGAGMGRLNLKERPKTIPEKQAIAAVGQVALIHLYQKLFFEYNKNIAQLLLTGEDLGDRQRFLNARNACFELISKNIIPIINENDSVLTEEIKIGDNDTLSALVSSLIDADLLIILSDIDGLYTADPRKDPEAKLISTVEEVTPEIKDMGKGAGSSLGTGGMATKIRAAEITVSKGINMLIANGENPSIIVDVLEGKEVGTLFLANNKTENSKKHWIKYNSSKHGKIVVDKGAEEAIKVGKSLLPKGIVRVEGDFIKGEVIAIYSVDKKEIGKGIVNYSSSEINLIKGRHSKDIEKILKYQEYSEVIHSNNISRD